MSLQCLSNSELLENTLQAVTRERLQTAIVLEHLEEVSRRMLFAELGYSSLFSFCVKELKYSEDQAQARISAMRVVREVPEAKPAIEDGRLSITNLAQVQTFLRQEKKAGKPYNMEAKQDLVMQMQGLTKRECERKLVALAPEHARHDSVRAVSDTEMRLSIVLSAETMADLERIRALWGNQDLGYGELIQKMASLTLERIDPAQKGLKKRASPPEESDPTPSPGPAQMIDSLKQTAKEPTRFIPKAVKTQVWARDGGRCTYIDTTNGRKCDETYALQFDHIIPFALNGPTTVENLRLACRAHNRLYAAQAFGA